MSKSIPMQGAMALALAIAPAAWAASDAEIDSIRTEIRALKDSYEARIRALEQRLKAGQIQVGIHYPVPAHLQEACAPLGYKAGDFPVTEAAAPRLLSLPMFAELSEAQIDYVTDAVCATSR